MSTEKREADMFTINQNTHTHKESLLSGKRKSFQDPALDSCPHTLHIHRDEVNETRKGVAAEMSGFHRPDDRLSQQESKIRGKRLTM